jgi:menaquinone-dependent protoporphyrinogen oxidase
MAKVLVMYGTSEGHTEKIANAIANTLVAQGCDADIIQAGSIDPNPADFDGIIVAASVHAGHYQKPVARWLRARIAQFGSKPTAFVSVCLGVLQHDPKVDAVLDANIHRFIDPIGWHPSVIKIVAGALQYTRYNVFIRWIMRRITAKAGGDTDTSKDYDYTDWNDLRAFAADFASRIRGGTLARVS